MSSNTKKHHPIHPKHPMWDRWADGMDIFKSNYERGNSMKKPYYKELPLFHIYDSNLTGSQKLLMTLLLIDDTYDMYTLSCLAKRPTEDVVSDLEVLKKQGYLQSR